MKYAVKTTSRFRKDYKLMQKRGLEMTRLDKVITMLASGETLDEKIPRPCARRKFYRTSRMPYCA